MTFLEHPSNAGAMPEKTELDSLFIRFGGLTHDSPAAHFGTMRESNASEIVRLKRNAAVEFRTRPAKFIL